jgi:hypothetical protein
MQELALARAPRHFLRVSSGPCINNEENFCILLLYILTTRLAIGNVTMPYSQQRALLLFLLLFLLLRMPQQSEATTL